MRIFWINLDIVLAKPLKVLDPRDTPTGERVHGALMTIGITAYSEEEAKSNLEAHLRSEPKFKGLAYRVDYDFVGEIQDLESDIYGDEDVAGSLLQDPRRAGQWYRTGVAWYED